MNLLNFPYLVQNEILKCMNYGDLFLISFASKRMQNLIRSVKWKEILRIECYACSFAFAIYNKDNTKVEVVACGSKEPNYIEETYAVTIDGKHIEVCSLAKIWDTNPTVERYLSQCFVLYKASEEKEVMEAVYNRLNFLFGKNATATLYSTRFDLLPAFAKSEATFLLLDFKKRSHYKRFEKYFETAPIQKHVSLHGMLPSLSENSKLYKAESLILETSWESAEDVLLKFKGKNAVIYDPQISDESVIMFLKRWKKSIAFQSLEFLRMTIFPRNIEKIYKELKIKMFPAGEEMPFFESKISPYFNFVFYYPSETPRTYIVRDDGIVAYITLESGKLWFQVKNFTEKQLVESGFSIG